MLTEVRNQSCRFVTRLICSSQMIDGCWMSCHSPCPITGRTFAADAIISNPPAFAHIHCAEALGIPLLLSFSKFDF